MTVPTSACIENGPSNDLTIVRIKLSDLRPSLNHARIHNRKQRMKLRALVQHYGVVRPLLVDPTNEIIDGHLLFETLKEMGAEDAPAIVVWNRCPAEIRVLRLALNRVAEDAGWDDPKLRREFEELIALGFDMELTGFDAVEIDMRLDVDGGASGEALEEADINDLEPAAAAVVVKLGDVWACGPHKLVCADATSGRVLELFPNLKASVVFTDPPYNVKIAGFVSGLGATRHREFAMAAGEMTREAFTAFLSRSVASVVPVLAEGAILFICMDWRHARELANAAETLGLEQKNLVVWVKSNAGMGSFYRSQHELVFVFKYGSEPHQNNFELGQHGRSRSNVWRYAGVNSFGRDRKEQLAIHPTCKPVAMIADALRDVSRRGETVIDPFLGSGSTLLAAEETGRVCVGVEIDPAYVEVAIRRWQKRTKRDAVCASTGDTFDVLCARHTAQAAMRDTMAANDGSASDTGTREAGDE